MELRRNILSAEYLDPRRNFERARTPLEVRWDPLTGHSARLLPPSGLLPRNDFDLEELAEETKEGCPFCADRLERATPKLPAEVSSEGRIHVGEAVLFPNLLAYSQYSSVSVYSPALHYLPLERITPQLAADNLSAQARFASAALEHDSSARWASINANHMLPSGSSIFHPHMQGGVSAVPTTMQRVLAGVPAERFDDYLVTERQLGRRYLGRIGRVEWLAGFAPIGPGELRAFVPGLTSSSQLEGETAQELGRGIATALGLYAELGFQSFNMAIYGAPAETVGYPLNLRMTCRSNLAPLYRSDVTWLERLHWEGAVDISPEDLADEAGERFRVSG